MTLRVIFFDMADTLVTVRPSWYALYVLACARHGIMLDEGAVARAYAEVFARLEHEVSGHTHEATREADERYYREINGAVLRTAGVPEDVPLDAVLADLHRTFDDPAHFHLFPDALPTLHALREYGYRLGIISNWDHRLFSIVEQLNLTSYFETVTASSAVGVAKPGRGIFTTALAAMKVPAQACLHVGDSFIDDYQGATAAGLRAVLLDRHGKLYNGAVRIDSLRELPALLS